LKAGAIGFADPFTYLLTCSSTRATGFTFIWPIFIDLAVAIVVEAIAEFGIGIARLYGTFDIGFIGFTGPEGIALAHTDADGAWFAFLISPQFID
jgi:hypothetical protein